ncbi:MAG: hypothetical protein ACI8UD_004234 [Planctomycetota bacterium]|jgi:hypothetical protein
MTKSEGSNRDGSKQREPRPFLYLKAASLPLGKEPVDPVGAQQLEERVQPQISHIVRSIVDYTIAKQNRNSRAAQPIQMSVLNRRRRAARAWLLAISEAKTDAATRHAVATQWLPLLCGTGPDLKVPVEPARELIEYVRGAGTACLFDGPSESLLPQARALHVFETTLAVHLAAVQQISHSVDRPVLSDN